MKSIVRHQQRSAIRDPSVGQPRHQSAGLAIGLWQRRNPSAGLAKEQVQQPKNPSAGLATEQVQQPENLGLQHLKLPKFII